MRKKRAHGLLVGLACALAAAGCGGDAGDGKTNNANVANTQTNANHDAPANVETQPAANETHATAERVGANANANANENANASGGGGEESVEPVLGEIASFTDELLKKIEEASDASAGVAAAQKFFDARAGEIRARIVAARASAQASAGARRSLLESEVDNSARISNLQTKYLDRTMSDAAFKTRLDKLVGDYRRLFED
ncbi:MAG TPA: hypothetical protein VF754_02140 [Pyrinomonadaceae bacterium]